jgi:hypothetical protein
MAINKVTSSSKKTIASILAYLITDEKTNDNLITSINCSSGTAAADEMQLTKIIFGKNHGRQYMHYINSFLPEEDVTPEQAHAIATAIYGERFPDYETIIITHTDKKHIHSHIIVNSVSFTDGRKFQSVPKDLQAIKDDSDELCLEKELSICVKGERDPATKFTTFNPQKYHAMKRAIEDHKNRVENPCESYIYDCCSAVSHAMYSVTCREEFIGEMSRAGYTTKWVDNRKYITFDDRDGNTIRDKNIANTYGLPLSKEGLEEVFASNIRYRADKKAEFERKKQESTAKAEAEGQILAEQQRKSVPEQLPPPAEVASEGNELDFIFKKRSDKIKTFIKGAKSVITKLIPNKTKDDFSLITAAEQPAPTPQVAPEELESAPEEVSAPKYPTLPPMQPMSPPTQPALPPKEVKSVEKAIATPVIPVITTSKPPKLTLEEKINKLFEENPPKTPSVTGELDVERYDGDDELIVPTSQPSPLVGDFDYDE